jgi:hypothetical protein
MACTPKLYYALKSYLNTATKVKCFYYYNDFFSYFFLKL